MRGLVGVDIGGGGRGSVLTLEERITSLGSE
jgi:hypothetical protein